MSIILYHKYDQYSLDLLINKIKDYDYTDSFKCTYRKHWPTDICNKSYIIIKFTCKNICIEKDIKELASGLKFRIISLEAYELEKYINKLRYNLFKNLKILSVINICKIPIDNIKSFSNWRRNISRITKYDLNCLIIKKILTIEEPKEHLCRCPPGYDDGTKTDCNGINYWCYYCNQWIHKFNSVLQEINVKRICQRSYKNDEHWYKLFLIMNTNLNVYYNSNNIHTKQGVHYHLLNINEPHMIDNDGNFQLYKNLRYQNIRNQKSKTKTRSYPIWPIRCGCCNKSKVIWID